MKYDIVKQKGCETMKLTLRIILAANTFALLPCAIMGISENLFLWLPGGIRYVMYASAIPVLAALKIFYLPYIFCAFTTIFYPISFIKDRKNGKLSIIEIICFVLLSAICITGVCSLEWFFESALTLH